MRPACLVYKYGMNAPASKKCTKCGIVKPLEQFGPDKRATDGTKPACRACYALYQRGVRCRPGYKARLAKYLVEYRNRRRIRKKPEATPKPT